MSAAWHSAAHAIYGGLPFGVMVGALLAPARLSGVDFRQWFRDPGQPAAYSDDSWIGLTIQGVAIAFVASIAGALLITPWIAWPHLAGWIVGIAAAQLAAEMAWRLGLRLVPDVVPAIRKLSPGAPTEKAQPSGAGAVRQRTGRRLIVCCDGTWNWPDRQRETNVVRLVRAIAAHAPRAAGEAGDPIPQISHYHLGVGTGNVLDRIIGGGIGVGLSSSVKACYGFIVDNYVPGDEIFLFGFSRGAYVARSVAGMLGRVGILKRAEMEGFIDAWDWYTDDRVERQTEDLDKIAPNRVKGEDVDIECIGVWDTVGALGIPGTRFCASSFKFHETELGPGVRHAFHAMAMDERRGNFQAAVWTPNPEPTHGQVLEQVWFPGVHSNIGGGYERHGLSDTTLLWMLSRLSAWNLLELDMNYIRSVLDRKEPYPVGELAQSRTWKWQLVGSPVPRPVGITTQEERVHESAFGRVTHGKDLRRGDIYRSARRRRWIEAMAGRKFERCGFEDKYAVHNVDDTPRERKPYKRKLALSACDSVLRWLNGKV